MDKHVVLVGCGKMGKSLLSGWYDKKVLDCGITVIEPNLQDDSILKYKNLTVSSDYKHIKEKLPRHIIIFAVKPQALSEVLENYKELKNVDFYVSIAAGKNISFFEDKLGRDASIIRAMPNLAATVQKSVTGLVANKNTSDNNKKIADELFNAVGTSIWLDDENNIDDLTAVSGSGPAYLFYFIESFIAAAKDLGFSSDMATRLVLETIQGSVELIKDSGIDVVELRKNVTSPKGTTEAALNVFSKDNIFANIIKDAVKAAKNRAIELNKNSQLK